MPQYFVAHLKSGPISAQDQSVVGYFYESLPPLWHCIWPVRVQLVQCGSLSHGCLQSSGFAYAVHVHAHLLRTDRVAFVRTMQG